MTSGSSSAVGLADTISAYLYAVLGWTFVGTGSLLTWSVLSAVAEDGFTGTRALFTLFMLGFAFVFVAIGLFINPGVRRRLDRRHRLTRFGRVRTVERRMIRTDEGRSERCVDCGDPIDRGLIRRYREEYAIAGIPIVTRSEGRNHYCLACATNELLGIDSAADRPDSRSDSGNVERRDRVRDVERE
ncbi:hypothetical protein [Halosolutus gelatinilyticus]|uniref:hypothetical protein n=1 Tax=Halosolutus gelatinilyticus TaxID=2931975 RepID=UPI001FF18437|nr:hypothetical protein [Halosolutus gelatinilyticus]